jgi:hypothetical protein
LNESIESSIVEHPQKTLAAKANRPNISKVWIRHIIIVEKVSCFIGRMLTGIDFDDGDVADQ